MTDTNNMNNCLDCVYCIKESERLFTDPYNHKKETHIDCLWLHTWHNAEQPCEKYATKI